MRIEKGHISGPEINGNTTPRDLGLGGMVSKTKDFIGCVLGARPGMLDPDRPALIGFRPVDRSARLRSGAHFLTRVPSRRRRTTTVYVTSVAYSPSNVIGSGSASSSMARSASAKSSAHMIPSAERHAGRGRLTRLRRSGRGARPWLQTLKPASAFTDSSRGTRPAWRSSRETVDNRELRCRQGPEGSLEAIREAYGVDLPAGPHASKDGHRVRLGRPRPVARGCRPGMGATSKSELKPLLNGLASVVDQSDGRAVVRVSGALARQGL